MVREVPVALMTTSGGGARGRRGWNGGYRGSATHGAVGRVMSRSPQVAEVAAVFPTVAPEMSSTMTLVAGLPIKGVGRGEDRVNIVVVSAKGEIRLSQRIVINGNGEGFRRGDWRRLGKERIGRLAKSGTSRELRGGERGRND